MSEDKTPMRQQPLSKDLKSLLKSQDFMRFDVFIIRKMCGEEIGYDAIDKYRRKAFHRFREITNHEEIASLPTMRKWFGIGGYSKPRRAQVYHMCFLMNTEVEVAAKFLTKGLGEPGFQICDYQEMIFLYGLCCNLTYEKCIDMMHSYELHIDVDELTTEHDRTNYLLNQFKRAKQYDSEEFLRWMEENSKFFKGYSITVMKYLEKYRKIIIAYIRKDAKERMDTLLEETDFEKWIGKKKGNKAERKILIRKYITAQMSRKNSKISQNLCNNILELLKIAYSKNDTNTRLLSEVYSMSGEQGDIGDKRHFQPIRRMSGKYLSDLFNIPIQKERGIRIAHANRVLEELDEADKCPEWIDTMCREYTKGKHSVESVGQAIAWIETYNRENRRRCLIMQRSDLLPMILYVAQRKFLDQIGGNMEHYNCEDARNVFINLADSTLSACHMEPFSHEYEMDVALDHCFGKEDMYSYADILEMLFC